MKQFINKPPKFQNRHRLLNGSEVQYSWQEKIKHFAKNMQT